MPKRKRGSTWYREVHQETDNILATISNSYSSQTYSEKSCDQIPEERQSSINENSSSIDLNYSDDSSSNSKSSSDFDDDKGVNSDLHSEPDIIEDNFCNMQVVTDNSDKEGKNGNRNLNSNVEKLRNWAVKNKITLSALNELLVIVADVKPGDFKGLPKDARTFLATPRKTLTRKVDPGEYYHFGIQKSLEILFHKEHKIPTKPVEIGINIDGLPLAKSSNSQFFPILGLLSASVFLIGLYHGYEKPKNFNGFLFDLINEAKMLTNDGVEIFGKKYNFKITKFLFDAVAKASILSIKGHAGYSSCTKCFQQGQSVQDRICFPQLNFERRTHESFVNQSIYFGWGR